MVQQRGHFVDEAVRRQLGGMDHAGNPALLESLGAEQLLLPGPHTRDDDRRSLGGQNFTDRVVPSHRDDDVCGRDVTGHVLSELEESRVRQRANGRDDDLPLGWVHQGTADEQTVEARSSRHATQALEDGPQELVAVSTATRGDHHEPIRAEVELPSDILGRPRPGFAPQIPDIARPGRSMRRQTIFCDDVVDVPLPIHEDEVVIPIE